MIFNTIILSALAAHVLAEPTSSQRIVHERRAVPLHTRRDRISEHAVIPVRIGLRQSNLDFGYDAVMDVSDPQSPNYGNHWTLEQVNDFFAPSDEAFEAIKEWLVEFGIDHELIGHSDNRQWIGVNIPVTQAEELLGAEYYEHEAQDGTTRIGCDEYSLPMHISKHVDYIKPGIALSPPLEKKTFTRRDLSDLDKRDDDSSWNPEGQLGDNGPGKKSIPSGPKVEAPGASSLAADLRFCGEEITPACIRALYNIPLNTVNTPNALGVVEYSPNAYSQQDLNEFFKLFAPNVPQGTHPTLVSIDGGKAPVPQPKAGDESDVDFEIAISLSYPQTVTLYQVGLVNFNAFTNQEYEDEVTFLTPFLDAIDGSFCTSADRKLGLQCGTASLTKVLSVSYSFPELFEGQPAAIRTCNEIMKLSLQGSTIIFASGDYGVAADPGPKYNGCINKDLVAGQSGTIFSPGFPVDCPYVLSVGGTQLYADETVNDPESVLYQPNIGIQSATFSSGGGFSNYFKRPSYQNHAVETYLSKYAPNYPSYVYNGFDLFSGKSNIGKGDGIYNRVGRGIPDVSANGANFSAVYEGDLELFYGTSLSTPIWASIVTIINEQRSKEGKSSVGFINPILYQNPQAFHDITSGTNPGCGTNGFPASPGWDPSSGLGTPNYPALLEVFSKAAKL